MPASIFNQPAGGSFAENLARARDFASGIRTNAAPPAVETEAIAALSGDIGAASAAQVATEMAGPVAAQQAPDLADAARVAAQASIADPAYAASAAQQLDVVVQPRLLVQGQGGPTMIPVDVAVPAAYTNVSIAPATAHVVDPATGQVVAMQAADRAATSSPLRNLRRMSAQDLGAMFSGGGGGERASVSRAPVAGAAARPGWRDQINNAIEAAKGPARAPGGAGAVVADGAAAVAKPSLLERIRAGAPDLAALRGSGGGGGAAAHVAGDVAEAAVKTAGATGRAGLFASLREAAELAAKLK